MKVYISENLNLPARCEVKSPKELARNWWITRMLEHLQGGFTVEPWNDGLAVFHEGERAFWSPGGRGCRPEDLYVSNSRGHITNRNLSAFKEDLRKSRSDQQLYAMRKELLLNLAHEIPDERRGYVGPIVELKWRASSEYKWIPEPWVPISVLTNKNGSSDLALKALEVLSEEKPARAAFATFTVRPRVFMRVDGGAEELLNIQLPGEEVFCASYLPYVPEVETMDEVYLYDV